MLRGMQKALLFTIALGAGIGFLLPAGKPAAPGAAPEAAVVIASTPAPMAAAASAAPVRASNPRETRVQREGNGHFYVDAEVKGQLVHFVVDTGASMVALTIKDAQRIGVPFSPINFEVVGTGASGPVRGERIMLDSISLDGKTVTQVRGAVLEGLDVSLLGQSYLSRISAVQMSGDYMTLR